MIEPANTLQLTEALKLSVQWHKDLIKQLDKMTSDKITSIVADVDGELITLLDDPRDVYSAKVGMQLIAYLIKDFPITIETTKE